MRATRRNGLVRALQDKLANDAVLSFYCSSNYQDYPLYTVQTQRHRGGSDRSAMGDHATRRTAVGFHRRPVAARVFRTSVCRCSLFSAMCELVHTTSPNTLLSYQTQRVPSQVEGRAMSLLLPRIGAHENHNGTLNRVPSETRPAARLDILQLLSLWRERHRHRQELMQMSARDLKDAGVPRDLVEHEARKWPWQKWNSQWQGLDEVLLRRISDRR